MLCRNSVEGGVGEIPKKRKGGWRRKSACNKSPNWFNFAVAGGCKILIGQSDNWRSRAPFSAFICLVTDMEMLAFSRF